MKKFLLILIAFIFCVSVIPVYTYAANDISSNLYIYGIEFKNEKHNTTNNYLPSDKIYGSAKVTVPSDSETSVSYGFSIIVSKDGKITAIETEEGIVNKEDGVVTIKTPLVELPSDVSGVKVWAMIHNKDFSRTFGPSALMGSSDCSLKKINIAGHDLIFTEDKYEYDITLYLTKDKFPLDVKAYPNDLSENVSIGSIDENITQFHIYTMSNDCKNEKTYKVNLKAYQVDSSSLTSISYDENTIENFDPNKKSYECNIDSDKLPVLSAINYDKDAKVTITQATEVPGTGVIHVEGADGSMSDYSVKFNLIKEKKIPISSFVRSTGNWHKVDDQSYINIYSNQKDIQGTISKAMIGFMLFDLNDENIKEILSAEFNGSYQYNLPATLTFYKSSVNDDMIKNCTYEDSEDGNIAKFIQNPSNKNYLPDASAKYFNYFGGLEEDNDDYILATDTISAAAPLKTTELDASKMNFTKDGKFLILVEKSSPIDGKQTYLYLTSTLNVKYVVE